MRGIRRERKKKKGETDERRGREQRCTCGGERGIEDEREKEGERRIEDEREGERTRDDEREGERTREKRR